MDGLSDVLAPPGPARTSVVAMATTVADTAACGCGIGTQALWL